jgi:hypothetical protein
MFMGFCCKTGIGPDHSSANLLQGVPDFEKFGSRMLELECLHSSN